jgi:hypothetical protein
MSDPLVREITQEISADKLADVLKEKVKEDDERARSGPASWSWSGPAKSLIDLGFKAGGAALRTVKGARYYALDRQSALELAALSTESIRAGRRLPQVVAELAKVIPDWMQTERPSADAGILEPMPKDPLGKEIGNPWAETTKDVRSQTLLTDAAPRLAKWLKACAEHGGSPTAQMLVELETEKEEATQMRRVCDSYDTKAWGSNKCRRDSEVWPDGINLTEQMQWTKSVEQTDKWLLRQHRAEAKAGPLRLGYDDHTIQNLVAKCDPELRKIHKGAGELLKKWQLEARKEAA